MILALLLVHTSQFFSLNEAGGWALELQGDVPGECGGAGPAWRGALQPRRCSRAFQLADSDQNRYRAVSMAERGAPGRFRLGELPWPETM